MKTIKALPYILKERNSIFKLENSSCCVANIHELVFAKKTQIGLHRNDYRKYFKNILCSQAPRFEFSELTLKSSSVFHTQSCSSFIISLTSITFHSNYCQLNPNPGHLALVYCNCFLFSLFLVSFPIMHTSFCSPNGTYFHC